ncbi:adenosylcobinamide-GDP ribazoletransferase [Halopseudomonas nanhaiensis]|uniref:adenosylcobinamide-GDP ribazoletransferase n=1 Tax=Halopseudomonas nanhaiensis TaxID=2830842 RepID=UPI001CBC3DB3|nr:adenosylcobinamide-GDP ribazoletransferase [Halopseudomonas nanhaiensis]UAW97096.1 adenosylcobinamide-GDP ribazoletransferase [Halopseudomonas nanhaiensis]
MTPLMIALQFLTAIPIRLSRSPKAEESGASLLWYPVVGFLVGLLLLLVQWSVAGLPILLQAALVLAFWVALTGGLHLDGLADTVDAWVGGHGDREKTLAIMKDPASGPMGVLALVLVLLIKFAALVTVIEMNLWWALLIAPWIGRWLLPALLLTTQYVRPGGLGQVLSEHIPRIWLPAVLFVHGFAMMVIGGFGWLLAVLLLGAVWRALIKRRVGGTTGDTAGALVELGEALALVGLVWANGPFVS